MKISIIAFLLLITEACLAGSATGKIVGYIPYSSGNEEIMFIKVENITGAASCNTTSRFTMRSNNPRYKATQAAALAAFMAGTTVKAKGLDSCNNWGNSEDLNYVCLGSIPC